MSTKATCGPRITGIQVTTHITAVLAFTAGGCTHEDVDATLLNVFDAGHSPEEYIDWGSPVFGKTIWEQDKYRVLIK
jgi:hypothetical protein